MLDTAVIEPRSAREWNAHYRIIRERLNRVPVPKVVFLWSPPSRPAEWPQAITINEVSDDLPAKGELPRHFPTDKAVTIIRVGAKYFGILEIELCSVRKNQALVDARHVIMYLIKDMTSRSFPEIGRRLGGRDHTTIIYGVARVARLIEAGDPIIADVAAIRALAVAADPGLAA